MPLVLRLAAGLLALPAVLPGAAAVRQVTVAAAPVERAAMVVTLPLPRDLADGAILRDAAGRIVPLQAEADLTAKFIVARQAANETLRFNLEPGRAPDQGNVQVVEEPSPPRSGNTPGIAASAGASMIQARTGRLRVSVGGRPVLYYQMDKDAVPREDIDPKWRRAGYLHPVLTPSGFSVTEAYPSSGPLAGSIPVGISSREPPNSPRPEIGAVDNTWSGPVHGGFACWQSWVESEGINPAELYNEAWELTAYAVPKTLGELNLFDLSITRKHTAANSTGVHDDLGPKVTGPITWEDQSPTMAGTTALFAEDTGVWIRAGSPELWGGTVSKSRWIGLTGPGQNRPAGFAILTTQPNIALGVSRTSFFLQSSDAGKKEITPGGQVTVRHRFVVFDGAPDNALLEALWNGYTVPAVVTISGP